MEFLIPILTIAGAALAAIIVFVIIFKWGVLGAAAATVIAQALAALICFFSLRGVDILKFEKGEFVFDRSDARTLFRLAFPMAFQNILICAGGITEKSPLLMQIYSDVIGKKMLLPASRETCALGAALCGAAAGKAVSSVEDGQQKMCRFKELTYIPDKKNQAVYDILYRKYCQISKEFAVGSLAQIMNS